MSVTYLKSFLFIITSIFLTACVGNPSHRLAIIGDVIISKNNNQALCFSPNLAKVRDNNTYVSLPYINVINIVIRRPINVSADEEYIQSIIKTKKGYYKMDENSKICLDDIPKELSYEIREPFDSNKHYAVYISGLNDSKRRNMSFSKEFSYPLK